MTPGPERDRHVTFPETSRHGLRERRLDRRFEDSRPSSGIRNRFGYISDDFEDSEDLEDDILEWRQPWLRRTRTKSPGARLERNRSRILPSTYNAALGDTLPAIEVEKVESARLSESVPIVGASVCLPPDGTIQTTYPLEYAPADVAAFCETGVRDYASCVRFCARTPAIWEHCGLLLRLAREYLGQGNEVMGLRLIVRYLMLQSSSEESGKLSERLQWLAGLVKSERRRQDFEHQCIEVLKRLQESLRSGATISIAERPRPRTQASEDPVSFKAATTTGALVYKEPRRRRKSRIAFTDIKPQVPWQQNLPKPVFGNFDNIIPENHESTAETRQEKGESQRNALETQQSNNQADHVVFRDDSQPWACRISTGRLEDDLKTGQRLHPDLQIRMKEQQSSNTEPERKESVQAGTQGTTEQELVVSTEGGRVGHQQQLNEVKQVENDPQGLLHTQEQADADADAEAVTGLDRAREETEHIQRELNIVQEKAHILLEKLQAHSGANGSFSKSLAGAVKQASDLRGSTDLQLRRTEMPRRLVPGGLPLTPTVLRATDEESLMKRLSGVRLDSSEPYHNAIEGHKTSSKSPSASIDTDLGDGDDATSKEQNRSTRKRKAESQKTPKRASGQPRSIHGKGQGRLMQRSDNGEDSDSEDDDSDGLVCSYFVKDPKRYRACGKLRLMTIAALKQHLQRKHKGPEYYCYRCFREFTSQREAEEHGQEDSCSKVKKPATDRIERDKWQRIERRHRGFTPAEAWDDIYRTIFGEIPPSCGIHIQEYERWLQQREMALHFSRLFVAFPHFASLVRREVDEVSTTWTSLPDDTRNMIQATLSEHALTTTVCHNASSETGFSDNWYFPILHNDHIERFVAPRNDSHDFPDFQSSNEIASEDLYGSNSVDLQRLDDAELFTGSTIAVVNMPPSDRNTACSTASTSASDVPTPSGPSDSAEEDWSQFLDPAVMLNENRPESGDSRCYAYQQDGGRTKN